MPAQSLGTFYRYAPAVTLLLFTACGEDDGEGGDPDLFLGLSGFVIFLVVVWLIWRAARRRG